MQDESKIQGLVVASLTNSPGYIFQHKQIGSDRLFLKPGKDGVNVEHYKQTPLSRV